MKIWISLGTVAFIMFVSVLIITGLEKELNASTHLQYKNNQSNSEGLKTARLIDLVQSSFLTCHMAPERPIQTHNKEI